MTPHASSLLQNQAPSPYSAIMTVSLEGYLEPQRISFSSPPNSELNPRPPSPDESFPVFSPPPYESAVGSQPPTHHRQSSIGPPWMHRDLVTPRQSIISFESRSQLSHHTCNSSFDAICCVNAFLDGHRTRCIYTKCVSDSGFGRKDVSFIRPRRMYIYLCCKGFAFLLLTLLLLL